MYNYIVGTIASQQTNFIVIDNNNIIKMLFLENDKMKMLI